MSPTCRGPRGVGSVLRHPVVLDRGLLQRSLVRLVVEPAVPLRRHHGGVVVHSVLGIVDDPAVPAVEVLVVLVVLVTVLVLPNQFASLKTGERLE